MSKPVIFPYGIALKEDGNTDTFPAVAVDFKTRENLRVSLFLLLDSGAALSALPKNDAAFFGIDVEEGVLMHISGISGKPIKGWRHRMNVRLAEEDFALSVVFLNDVGAPRVLGRADVFERFTVIFEECAHRSIFLRTGSEEARSLRSMTGVR